MVQHRHAGAPRASVVEQAYGLDPAVMMIQQRTTDLSVVRREAFHFTILGFGVDGQEQSVFAGRGSGDRSM
jgi:hypothetical protein